MTFRGRPNCQNLDNYRRCRVHLLPWWLRWLAPSGRETCILDGPIPQDGKLECPDQVEWPRPAPPKSWNVK